MYYDILAVDHTNCPPACNLCVEACRSRSETSGEGTIQKIDLPEQNFHSVLLCNQCSQPECGDICPTGAIRRSSAGVVNINGECCIGCGLCTLVCPYGGVYLNFPQKKAGKCDLCGGSPKCAEACPYGILAVKKARPLVSQLGEDLLSPGLPFCSGCLMELLSRFTLQALGKDIILFGAPSCAVLGELCQVAYYGCLMTNVPSSMTGVKRYFKRIHRDATCVAIVGDGTTADVGFQVLSAAAERGEKILYICYDNEGYMNTGIQRSSTTPPGSWTTTTPVGEKGRGKKNVPKNLPLLMAFHEIPYVATATLAYLEDYSEKLKKARSALKDGMAYIHVLCPCPTGWRCSAETTLEVCRTAVETNYFPLWEAEHGNLGFTHEEPHPKPIKEFTRLMGRFSHLSEEELYHLQKYVNQRYEKIKNLTRLKEAQDYRSKKK
ncbi:MAG: 4Fe-4S dicluster domain-containing protein [Deltaproteobacteria bacterium]|nr:4Fe-4S dicluster domain-containing protein [Deltaproteobacteria bacterium]